MLKWYAISVYVFIYATSDIFYFIIYILRWWGEEGGKKLLLWLKLRIKSWKFTNYHKIYLQNDQLLSAKFAN